MFNGDWGNVRPPESNASIPITMPHVVVLDGIRALAIIIVYLSHSGMGNIVPGGLGISIFFFLSGFLITSLLRVEYRTTGTVSLRNFYMRRILRIIPPLWFSMLFVGVLVALDVVAGMPNIPGVIAQGILGSNYADVLTSARGLPNMPLWSLAVEEHFYLVFPLAFLWLVRRTTTAGMVKWCGAACVATLIARCHAVFVLGDTYNTYYLTHTRIDSILFGCILAIWQNPVLDREAWRPSRHHVGLAILALAGTIAVRSPAFRETIRYSIQSVSLFVLFSAILWSTGPVRQILAHRVLRKIGLFSYTIYLIHLCFMHVLASYVTDGSMVAAGVLGILPTWAYAALMYRYVERPLASWRRRMNAHPATPASVQMVGAQ